MSGDGWRSVYASRFRERIVLHPANGWTLRQDRGIVVPPVAPASVLEAWAEMMRGFCRPLGERSGRAA